MRELNEIIQVHIWELPLKNNDINKSSEFMMVHDGALKKIKVEDLYEYFNQDYKVKNTVEYFENFISVFNKEYEPKYIILVDSLNHYENRIRNFQEDFNSNRETIRELESGMYILGVNNDGIKNSLNVSETNHNSILNVLDSVDIEFDRIKTGIYENRDIISDYNNETDTIIITHTDINNRYQNMKVKMEFNQDELKESVLGKKNTLIQRMKDEYDKFLAIFDHYHHISDE